MKSIKVYSREGCGYCDKLKPQVAELITEHPEINISIVDDTANYKAGKGFKSYPMSVGYDENGQVIREVLGCPAVGAKEHVLTAINPRTIADLSVMELVKERDAHIMAVNLVEAELNKRK